MFYCAYIYYLWSTRCVVGVQLGLGHLPKVPISDIFSTLGTVFGVVVSTGHFTTYFAPLWLQAPTPCIFRCKIFKDGYEYIVVLGHAYP